MLSRAPDTIPTTLRSGWNEYELLNIPKARAQENGTEGTILRRILPLLEHRLAENLFHGSRQPALTENGVFRD